jgi:fatty-acyl-CoA synthase
MIVSGGENVYPAEVENVLMQHPAVADGAVIGVPDERWGETPAVIAVTDGRPLDGRAVLDRCEGVLADFKLPRYLVVRDQPLPRNMSNKVLKAELRAEYADLPTTSEPIR